MVGAIFGFPCRELTPSMWTGRELNKRMLEHLRRHLTVKTKTEDVYGVTVIVAWHYVGNLTSFYTTWHPEPKTPMTLIGYRSSLESRILMDQARCMDGNVRYPRGYKDGSSLTVIRAEYDATDWFSIGLA